MSDGVRERKKSERRGEFVRTAQSLVAQRGLECVTVLDICEEVGVSERTFFNYFATKEDAVLGLALGGSEVELELAEEFVAGGPTGELLLDGVALVTPYLRDDARLGGREGLRFLAQHRILAREPRLLARMMVWAEQQRARVTDLVVLREESHPSGIDPIITSGILTALGNITLDLWLAQARDTTTVSGEGDAPVVASHASGSSPEPQDLLPEILQQLQALAWAHGLPAPKGPAL